MDGHSLSNRAHHECRPKNNSNKLLAIHFIEGTILAIQQYVVTRKNISLIKLNSCMQSNSFRFSLDSINFGNFVVLLKVSLATY